MKKEVSLSFMMAGILFSSCLLISNILASKIIAIGSWTVPAAVLIFPVAYILNDVITEVWGYSKARLIIWTGFAVNLIAVVFFSIGIAVPSASFWKGQEAFRMVLGSTPRIVVASLTAYLAGSFMNAFIMSRMKSRSRGKGFSLRAILSTLLGEGIDSCLFITIAFLGILPLSVLPGMILIQALFKVTYEILVLPVTIMVVSHVKRMEKEVFDVKLSYNPFKFKEI